MENQIKKVLLAAGICGGAGVLFFAMMVSMVQSVVPDYLEEPELVLPKAHIVLYLGYFFILLFLYFGVRQDLTAGRTSIAVELAAVILLGGLLEIMADMGMIFILNDLDAAHIRVYEMVLQVSTTLPGYIFMAARTLGLVGCGMSVVSKKMKQRRKSAREKGGSFEEGKNGGCL